MSEEIEKAQILFVDDEPNILRSLERAFLKQTISLIPHVVLSRLLNFSRRQKFRW